MFNQYIYKKKYARTTQQTLKQHQYTFLPFRFILAMGGLAFLLCALGSSLVLGGEVLPHRRDDKDDSVTFPEFDVQVPPDIACDIVQTNSVKVEKEKPKNDRKEKGSALTADDIISKFCVINEKYKKESHKKVLAPEKATANIQKALKTVMQLSDFSRVFEILRKAGQKLRIDFTTVYSQETIVRGAQARYVFKHKQIYLCAGTFTQYADQKFLTVFLANELQTFKVATLKQQFYGDQKLSDEQLITPFCTHDESTQLEQAIYDGLLVMFKDYSSLKILLGDDSPGLSLGTTYLLNILKYKKVAGIQKLITEVLKVVDHSHRATVKELMKRANEGTSIYHPLNRERQLSELDSDIASLQTLLSERQRQSFAAWRDYHEGFTNHCLTARVAVVDEVTSSSLRLSK